MTSTYNKAKVCPYEKQNCDKESEGWSLNPNITKRFSKSRDVDELKYLWKSWRDNTGKLMRGQYKSLVELMNKAAKENKYDDASKWWQSEYEIDFFENQIDALWEQVQSLYNELHTYVRYKLLNIYGKLNSL